MARVTSASSIETPPFGSAAKERREKAYHTQTCSRCPTAAQA